MFKNITQDELKALYAEEPAKLPYDVLLDVRTAAEFDVLGHLPKATLMPVQELEHRVRELQADANILVMCQHGVRSANAAWFLTQNGFNNITNLTEGLAFWNGPVEQNGEVITGHSVPDSLFVTDFL